MPMRCPCEASRANADFLAGRSLAAFGILRARTMFSDCLGSLLPSERSGTELKSAKMKCSGVERAESGESVIGRGRNRADAWREERAQVSARCGGLLFFYLHPLAILSPAPQSGCARPSLRLDCSALAVQLTDLGAGQSGTRCCCRSRSGSCCCETPTGR